MKQVYIIQEKHPKLLLFFAGWAMDEEPFKHYHPEGMDYMICYDYRSLDFDYSIFDRYEWINIVAWSMGVWAGGYILNQVPPEKRTRIVPEDGNIIPSEKGLSIAVCGSTYPVDDAKGIPYDLFSATLENLTAPSLLKFMRRMCEGNEAYKAFMQKAPHRNFEEVKEELQCINDIYLKMSPIPIHYDYAYVGLNDRIFPHKNLCTAFKDTACIEINCSHYNESLFRFLLQDQWSMVPDEHLRFRQHLIKDNCC